MKKLIVLILALLVLSGCGFFTEGDGHLLPAGFSFQRLGYKNGTEQHALWVTLKEIPYEYFKIRTDIGNEQFQHGESDTYISKDELNKIIFLKRKAPYVISELMEQIKKCENDGLYYYKKDLVEVIDRQSDTIKYYLKKK